MTDRLPTLAAAAALTLAALVPAGADDAALAWTARQGATVPAVIGLAYRDPRVAANAADVLRQGGLAVAGTARWLPAAEAAPEAPAFGVPAVIGAAFHDRRVATTAAEVRRQSGFATAGRARWRAAAPVAVEASADPAGLGSL